jgi:TolA-binding protein
MGIRLAVLALLAASVGCGLARSGGMLKAREHFAKGKYQLALNESNSVLSTGWPSAAERAQIFLFKAKCLEKLGAASEAAALYTYIINHFPHSPQDYQARASYNRLERRGGDRCKRQVTRALPMKRKAQ